MYIVVFVTTKDKREAEKIAQKLIEEKLAACANIVDGVQSIFWWKGKVDQSNEALMILKSKEELLEKIILTVKALHSYTVPEVIALPLLDGNPDYLKWIEESV